MELKQQEQVRTTTHYWGYRELARDELSLVGGGEDGDCGGGCDAGSGDGGAGSGDSGGDACPGGIDAGNGCIGADMNSSTDPVTGQTVGLVGIFSSQDNFGMTISINGQPVTITTSVDQNGNVTNTITDGSGNIVGGQSIGAGDSP